MRVRWLRTALHNIDAELAHIAQEDQDAAIRIYAYIMERVAALATSPNAGRPGRIFGTRELVIERYPYIVPYRVRGDAVEILRVFHTSRLPPKNW
ncbi:MAG: type II toxin-antitoxin system RelE/ParE family toxin [Solidesulfovibrio sp.]